MEYSIFVVTSAYKAATYIAAQVYDTELIFTNG